MTKPHEPMRFATIIKTFRFEAAHQLVNSGTACDYVHGHSYKFEVHLWGVVQEVGSEKGMVMNFANISATVKRLILNVLDHKFISADGREPFVRAGLYHLHNTAANIEAAEQAFMRGVSIIYIPTTTAEEVAKWIGDTLYSHGLPVSRIRFWETETGAAEYQPVGPPSSILDATERADQNQQPPSGEPLP